MISAARHVLALFVGLLLLTACGSESEPTPKASPPPPIGASHRGDIDVLGAVFVMNDDGSTTLSAEIVNHLDLAQDLVSVSLGDDPNGPDLRLFQTRGDTFRTGQTVSVGGETDPVWIRFLDVVKPGADLPAILPLQLQFYAMSGFKEKYTDINLNVPVVQRSPEYDAIVGNRPNTAIKAIDAKIVVVPGQRRAYVGGSLTGSITDHAWELPTAADAEGNPVEYRHQTATGGPYGMLVEAGKTIPFGGPPYVVPESDVMGDADYFDAKDVTIGETITVTIPFQSGDVVVPFKVVAG
jgi:hypothetical protein